jgi:hypothetical protein
MAALIDSLGERNLLEHIKKHPRCAPAQSVKEFPGCVFLVPLK